MRVIQNFKKIGFKGYWHQLNYIGDTKAGRFVGQDESVIRYLCLCSALMIATIDTATNTTRTTTRLYTGIAGSTTLPSV